VWVSDSWDAGPIVLTGNVLREEGYGSRVVVVRNRDPEHVFAQMMTDPGTQFVGLHYSMGGNASLLSKTYEATRRASAQRGVQLRYHAVLIDPYDISALGVDVDPAQPEVGRLLFVLSSEHSMLRGRVSELAEAVKHSPKVNFIYAEDVGEKWGHFSILPSGRTLGQSGTSGQSGASSLANHKTMMLLRAFFSTVQAGGSDGLQATEVACLVAL